MWQDYAFTLGSLGLCFTMIPMLRAEQPPPFLASAPIAAILAVFTVCYITLGFVVAPWVEGTQTLAWAWLAWRAT